MCRQTARKLFARAMILLLFAAMLVSCASKGAGSGKGNDMDTTQTQTTENPAETTKEQAQEGYLQITQEQAKELMDHETNYILLDVRTQEEFDAGHIPGAVLIPDYEITEKAQDILPDKDQLILVYCRSGRRSKGAAEELAAMGYTNIQEFGGILTWPYETVSE